MFDQQQDSTLDLSSTDTKTALMAEADDIQTLSTSGIDDPNHTETPTTGGGTGG